MEEIFAYVEELYGRIKFARMEANKMKNKQIETTGMYFVHCEDKEYINPELLPFEQHFMLVQFGDFIRMNNKLRYQDILKILNQNKSMFEFFIDAMFVVPNIVNEARKNSDEKFLSYMYWGLKRQNANKTL